LGVETVIFQTAEKSIYAGLPSPELDAAWDDLLYGINIRVSQEELSRANQTTVRLADGRSGLAWLEGAHQLHCVVREVPLKFDPRCLYSSNSNLEITEIHQTVDISRSLSPQC
jgi:hypothetical protein